MLLSSTVRRLAPSAVVFLAIAPIVFAPLTMAADPEAPWVINSPDVLQLSGNTVQISVLNSSPFTLTGSNAGTIDSQGNVTAMSVPDVPANNIATLNIPVANGIVTPWFAAPLTITGPTSFPQNNYYVSYTDVYQPATGFPVYGSTFPSSVTSWFTAPTLPSTGNPLAWTAKRRRGGVTIGSNGKTHYSGPLPIQGSAFLTVHNPGAAAATVTVSVTGPTGASMATTPLTIPALQTGVSNITVMPGVYSLGLSSTAPVSPSLTLFNNPSSSLPTSQFPDVLLSVPSGELRFFTMP